MPALHWFAAHQDNPAIDTRERDLLASPTDERHIFQAATYANRLFPLSIHWLDPELAGKNETETLPLHWKGEGRNPIAVHRVSWDSDSLYVGIKGGSPSQNHGHMDVGSFVLDDQGVRWATDIKGQGYRNLEERGMDIWDYSQESDRWRVFNMNTHGHNTLVIDGQHQLVDGFAPILSFSPDPGNPFTVVDMSTIYSDWAATTIRGVRFLNAHAVLFSDRLSGLDDNRSVRWGMVTKAEVELEANRATLRLGGKTLHATILEPVDTVFDIVPTDPPPNEWDAPNPGTRMLALFAASDHSQLRLKVIFSREELTPARIEEFRALPDPIEW
jgi:hypothetical protein